MDVPAAAAEQLAPATSLIADAAVQSSAADQDPAGVTPVPAADDSAVHFHTIVDDQPEQRAVEEEEKSPQSAGNAQVSADPPRAVSVQPPVSPVAARENWSPEPDTAFPAHVISIDVDNTGNTTAHLHPHPAAIAMHAFNTTLHATNSTGQNLTAAHNTAVPRAGHSPLKTVPLEVLSLMLTYLDAQSLVRFAATSSAHNSLACKRALWTSLLARPWTGRDDGLPGPGLPLRGIKPDTQAKQFYGARRILALEKRAERAKNHAERRVDVARNHRSWWTLLVTDFFFLPCLAAFSLIFLVCIVWQLARGESVSYFSLWPLLAMGGLLGLVATVLCCTKYCSYSLGLSDSFHDDSRSIVKSAMEIIGQGDSALGHCSFCTMLAVCFLFLLFLTLKVTGTVNWGWWAVFSPLYVVFASFCCAPCLRWPSTSRIKIKPCVAVWALLGLPLLAFTLLLNFRLADSSSMGLSMVFIPLWLMDLMVLLLAIAYCVSEGNAWGLLAWLLAAAPLVVFKVLLAVAVDADYEPLRGRQELVWIPLYVTEMILLCGAAALTMVTIDDAGIEYEDDPGSFSEPLPPV